MEWFWLTLFSAFSLATADALTKKYLSHYPAGDLVLARFAVPGLLLLPLLLFQPWPKLPTELWYWMLLLIPTEILAMWLYMKAIRQSPLALTVPYLAFTPVFNILTGYLLLEETINPKGFFGIVLVVCGAWLLNLEKPKNGESLNILAPFQAIMREPGSRIMLIVSLLYSLSSVAGKGAMNTVEPLFFGPFYLAVLGILSVIIFGGGKHQSRKKHRQNIFAELAVGFFMAAMVLSHFYAIGTIEVAYMIAVKRLSLLFGILYGAWLFGETGFSKNLAAGMLMVLGVVLIVG